MQHSYIDKYAGVDSLVHRIDIRLKIISSFAFILFIAFTPPLAYFFFILYTSLLLFLIFISKVPLRFILKKSLIVIPFIILVAVFLPFFDRINGLTLFWSIVIKSYLSILCMILLTSTTKFTKLLKGLERLRLPKIFIMILSFMYRYLFLSIEEVQRMQRARESRSPYIKGRLRLIKVMANIVGVLFIRSYERAERVYLAMCSRGFKGEIKTVD